LPEACFSFHDVPAGGAHSTPSNLAGFKGCAKGKGKGEGKKREPWEEEKMGGHPQILWRGCAPGKQ